MPRPIKRTTDNGGCIMFLKTARVTNDDDLGKLY